MIPSLQSRHLQLLIQPPAQTFELVAFHSSGLESSPGAGWPLEPGRICRRADGRVETLYFAPGRWLICDPQDTVLAALRGAPGGALVEVTGKWLEYQLTGTGAARLLASTLDIHAVLADRDCGRVFLFDCPGIVVRSGEGFSIFVQRSHGHALASAITRAAGQLGYT